MNRSVYVITPSAQSGKSIVCLGLMQMLKRMTPNVGYFKPLIEDRDEVDNHIEIILSHFKIDMAYEDAFAFSRSELIEMQNQGKINDVYDGIIKKYKQMEEDYDFILVEGSDFNEEGSVFEVDFNGAIARSLGIPVLLVVKDSFDTVTELVNHAVLEVISFARKDVNIIGVIISRCFKDIDEVKERISKRLRNNVFVSAIPNLEELGKPMVREIAEKLGAHVLFGEDKLDTVAGNIIVGGMTLGNYLKRIKENSVCVIPGDRSDLVAGTMLANMSQNYPNLTGVVLSGGFMPERSVIRLIDRPQYSIPVMAAHHGTFEAATAIASIKPKIYPGNKYKIKTSIDLFESSVDMEALAGFINSVADENITPRMFQYNMLNSAKKAQRHIVLPEGDDDRILTAASQLARDKIVTLTILGDPHRVRKRFIELGLAFDEERIHIEDPHNSEYYEDFAQTLYELRKS